MREGVVVEEGASRDGLLGSRQSCRAATARGSQTYTVFI